MSILTTTDVPTLARAREFVTDNRIACEDDWDDQPWYNRWQIFNGYKIQLAEDLSPTSPQWSAAVKALAMVLQV